jgi:glycosyltransferase involved in cell wall biosynthesis
MPLVTIIVPCYNEQDTIGLLLHAIYSQSYPLAEMEVVIADGASTDQTRQQIQNFQRQHQELVVRVVENVRRTIPSGLNAAIRAAEGQIIIRLDAHSIPHPDYIAKCQAALQAGCGDNVGGVWEIMPGSQSWLAKSIAAAAALPLGAGDARYRIGGMAQAVDTVPFGAFYRSLVEKIGYFDESLLTNEDYEFNVRIRKSGGKVWMDPMIRTKYFARSTLDALWRQYWRYGYWKAQMLKRYPQTLRWRQAIPPLFVLSLVLLLVTALWLPVFRWLLVLEVLIYNLTVFTAGFTTALRDRAWYHLVGVPLSLWVMHLAWGGGMLYGAIRHEQS